MAEKKPTDALRQTARTRAAEIAPTLVGVDREAIEGSAANRRKLEKALNFLPKEIDGWVQNHRGQAVGEIAVTRGKLFASRAQAERRGEKNLGRPDPYYPLRPLTRAALGDDLARDLLEEAEYCRG
jgi:hypothetical protein